MSKFDSRDILSTLDQCADRYTFPMLDNGYVYLAATRLSLFRSAEDWALVIEVFGYSPRAWRPSTHLYTFASQLHNRDTPDRYTTSEAHGKYLETNPNNESRFVHPIADGPWQDEEDADLVAVDAREVVLRGTPRPIPSRAEYSRHGIALEDPSRVMRFELCRFFAGTARTEVLSSPEERRISVLPGMTQILQLEDWNHPDVVEDDQRPSGSQTFQQLAEVLVTGDVSRYQPSLPGNTHWRNWPDGGRL